MTPAQRSARHRAKLKTERRRKPLLEKQERRRQREAELAAATVNASLALGTELYGVIYADPPWRLEPWSRETGMDRAADNHYPTMPLEEIKAIKVPAAENCVLFLWAFPAVLRLAIAVIEAWGFEYKSACAWKKPGMGTGHWFRFEHEVLLVAVRGTVPAPAPGTQWDSMLDGAVIEASATRHSAKPDAFARMIEDYFPTTPKVEMFARRRRDGWDTWGNEVVLTEGS